MSTRLAGGERLFRCGGGALDLTEAGQHVLIYAEEILTIGQDCRTR